MRFIEKVKTFATGKSELERRQESAAMREIKKDVNTARLKTRREEAIKFATESEKLKYANRLKKMKQTPAQNFWTGVNYGSPMGQPRILPIQRKAPSRTSKKRTRTRRRARRTSPQRILSQRRFNMISGGWE